MAEAKSLIALESNPESQTMGFELVREFFDPASEPSVTLYYIDSNHVC